jgi:putative intracellular protease/amidase
MVCPRKVLVPIADGIEEIESIIVIDTLGPTGASVTVASLDELLEVRCKRML